MADRVWNRLYVDQNIFTTQTIYRSYPTHGGSEDPTTFDGCSSANGHVLKIATDPTYYYAATSCSDRSMAFVSLEKKTCLASMQGHSSPATGMAFLNDGKHLVTVSGDG